MSQDPALGLLLACGLAIFWLIPLSAWLMLEGRHDLNARLWFGGTLCYAVAGLLFALQGSVPPWLTATLAPAFATATVLLMSEALRRERSTRPTRWVWLLALVAAEVVVLALLHASGLGAVGRSLHLALITVLDGIVLARIVALQRAGAGRSLWIVAAAFVAVMAGNVARMAVHLWTGDAPRLLDFSPVANYAFIANFTAVALYSFGYWGFVLEKSRRGLAAERSGREQAQRDEASARDREHATRQLLREREELIAELARVQRAAQAGALSASIAHEINQPLTAMRLDLETALALLPQPQGAGLAPDARLHTLLRRVGDQNLRVARIVRTLREAFGARAGPPETRSVDEIVSSMLDLVRPRARQQGVRLDAELSAPVVARAGAGELEHVVLNLLANAVDAAPASRSSEPFVAVKTAVKGGQVTLRVSDSGPGLPPQQHESVFELLRSDKPDGMGLGLWLSRHLAERHGGTLAIDASLTPGAAFVLSLPQASASGQAPAPGLRQAVEAKG
jgi:C4-dicarboxylate-specific signal transduction histidine kinase